MFKTKKRMKYIPSWFVFSAVIAIGDAYWMLLSFMPAFFTSLSFSLATVPLLNFVAYFTIAYLVHAIRNRQLWDSELFLKIFVDSLKLAHKVFAAVLMYSIGALIAPMILSMFTHFVASTFGFTLGGPFGFLLTHIATAFIIGFCSAVGVSVANIINEMITSRDIKKMPEILKETAKLFAGTFVAAATWYFCGLLPGANVFLSTALSKIASMSVEIFITVAATFMGVSGAFYFVTHPQQAARSIKSLAKKMHSDVKHALHSIKSMFKRPKTYESYSKVERTELEATYSFLGKQDSEFTNTFHKTAKPQAKNPAGKILSFLMPSRKQGFFRSCDKDGFRKMKIASLSRRGNRHAFH